MDLSPSFCLSSTPVKRIRQRGVIRQRGCLTLLRIAARDVVVRLEGIKGGTDDVFEVDDVGARRGRQGVADDLTRARQASQGGGGVANHGGEVEGVWRPRHW